MTGCAGVTVHPLGADGKYDKNKDNGVVYYRPMPYLLVVNLPADDPAADSEKKNNSEKDNSSKKDSPAKDSGEAPTDSTKTSPSPPSDTSFSAATKQHFVKLVYLPDFSQAYAVTSSTGLWGSAQLNIQLQDGWMLTTLGANADSKTSEMLSAIASMAGAGTGAAGGKPATGKKAQEATREERVTPEVLHPGLYRFVYDESGRLKSLDAVTYFCNDGPRAVVAAKSWGAVCTQ